MKIKVKVTFDVDWCDEDLGIPKKGDPLETRLCDSLVEAVMNSLKNQAGDGYNHDMEELIAIIPEDCKAKILR